MDGSMFVDACAIISILSGEETRATYLAALTAADAAQTSPLAAFEAVLILARPEKLGLSLDLTCRLVLDWLDDQDIELRESGEPHSLLAHAVEAASRFGVSKRALSVQDCFHYAQAKTAAQPLLTLDETVRRTDVVVVP
jgi:ribonuclease VapC